VAPGIFWIRMPLPFALDHINLWLLEDRIDGVDGWTIVDTGYGSETTHAIWDSHFATTLAGKPVLRIIVTHYHPDHVGCANWLQEKTKAPLWMTAAEFLSAHAAADDTAGFDRANSAALFVSHGVAQLRPDHKAAQDTRTNAFKRGVAGVPRRYVRMMEGDVIAIGKRNWRVSTVFGHAPEHAVLFAEDGHILISGDQVLPKISTNVGVWGNQPDANPLKQFLDSFAKFDPMPADTLVLPSHGLVFTGLHERVNALRAHHADRLAALDDALATPKSAAEVLTVLFKRALDDHQLIFAMGEGIAHLNYLWHSGRATRQLGDDGVYRFTRVAA
jgi:glyoxylase-like metal-dependent hydrolase (beta-lactamase superfamily II)